jgi:hypothetical protein
MVFMDKANIHIVLAFFWVSNKKLKGMKKIEKYLLGFHINDKFPHWNFLRTS